MSGAIEKAKTDFESSHKALLQRLFPDVKVDSSKKQDLNSFTESLAEKLKVNAKSAVEKAAKESSQKASSAASDEEVKKLEKQVDQYKTVLAQTVS